MKTFFPQFKRFSTLCVLDKGLGDSRCSGHSAIIGPRQQQSQNSQMGILGHEAEIPLSPGSPEMYLIFC